MDTTCWEVIPLNRNLNFFVRTLAVSGFMDTQCGFKCFHETAGRDLFQVQRLDGWTFDVEVLFIAQHRGYRIVEVPIQWYYFPASRIHVLQDSLHMFMDLFKIRLNWMKDLYATRVD